MPKAVPNEMRDEAFADAKRKPNNPPSQKKQRTSTWMSFSFHCSAQRFKKISMLTPYSSYEALVAIALDKLGAEIVTSSESHIKNLKI
jgi:hypothetical protein